MGKPTISMAIFNSYVKLPEGTPYFIAGLFHGSSYKMHDLEVPPWIGNLQILT